MPDAGTREAGRAPPVVLNVLAAFAIAFVLSASYLLDGPDDQRAEWATAQSLMDAQAHARRAAHDDKAARALCRALAGPNTGHRWTPDGEVACFTRRQDFIVTTAVRP